MQRRTTPGVSEEQPQQQQPQQQQQQQHQRLVRPPDKTRWQKVKDFVWDKEKKMCLTRTPINWLMITIYYIIFLAAVFIIFFLAMFIAYKIATKSHDRPQYILGDSPIGGSPALNFFPMYRNKPLIWLSSSRSYQSYINTINKEFDSYKKKDSNFSTDAFGDCKAAPFGYDTKTPCIFFRLNRLLMWKPTPYIKGDSLPKDIPQEVQSLIENSTTPKIWMSCHGSTAKDRDHMSNNFFQLQGSKGFDTSPFPFNRQKDFVDPIVAVKVNGSEPVRILFSFTCYAWGKKFDRKKSAVDVTLYFE